MIKYRVLLLGNIIGSYRSQYIIEYLSQRNYDFAHVYLSSQMMNFHIGKETKPYSRLLCKVLSRFYKVLFPLLYLVFLPVATHVIMLPMNERYAWLFGLARRFGRKTVMDFYSSRATLHENNFKIGQMSAKHKGYTKLRKFDISVIVNADELIFLNKSEAEFYLQMFDLLGNDIQYRIAPLVTPLRARANLPGFRHGGRFTLCWWGKASRLHGLELVFDSIGLLKEKDLDFHLYLLEIDRKRALVIEEMVESYNLQDVASVRFDLSFSGGLEEFLVQNCDIALGSFGDTGMAKTVLINKALDAMSMGIPMITRETLAIAEFGLDKGILFTCVPDAEALCNAILNLMRMELDVDTYQQTAIDMHRRNFSPQRFYTDLDELFQYMGS